MGERLLCKQEVIGSIPFTSTSLGALLSCLMAQRFGGWLAEIST